VLDEMGEGQDAAVAQSAPLNGIGTETRAPEAYALPGRMLVDLRTQQISVDLRAVEVGPRSVAPQLAANEVALEFDAGGREQPRIPIGRSGNDRVKRTFDIVAVLVTAPLWLPLVALLALAVKCTSRGPAFYTQQRVGRHGRVFGCTKLRTMAADADIRLEELLRSDPILREEFQSSYKLRKDPRITRIGQVLRVTGLDELPQLFAVLRGWMSLVGPRPIVVPETQYYGPYLPLVQTVRPGLTGLWQVSGRNDLSYPLRVAYDVQYVLTRSLWTDVKLILKTLTVTLRPSRRGAY
jgi:lipopolysaccharide/colanic/teichoic acid biosynthesis glycosyltransferase